MFKTTCFHPRPISKMEILMMNLILRFRKKSIGESDKSPAILDYVHTIDIAAKLYFFSLHLGFKSLA